MAITYKEVNVLHLFKATDIEICKEVWEKLVGKESNILVSYRTNIDDPRDVEFVVGAPTDGVLRDFIVKYADILSQLSSYASAFIKKHYTGELSASGKVRPVIYLTASQVIEGPEVDGSLWYETRLQTTFTKYFIRTRLESMSDLNHGEFVKVAE